MKDTQGGICEVGLAEREDTQVISWSNRAQALSGKNILKFEKLEHSRRGKDHSLLSITSVLNGVSLQVSKPRSA